MNLYNFLGCWADWKIKWNWRVERSFETLQGNRVEKIHCNFSLMIFNPSIIFIFRAFQYWQLVTVVAALGCYHVQFATDRKNQSTEIILRPSLLLLNVCIATHRGLSDVICVIQLKPDKTGTSLYPRRHS